MLIFNTLHFNPHPTEANITQCKIQFSNGYGATITSDGTLFTFQIYKNGVIDNTTSIAGELLLGLTDQEIDDKLIALRNL